MANRKAEKRKRKLAHKREWQAARHRRAQYPEFVFIEKDGDPDFVSLVRGAVSEFDFEELSAGPQRLFRDMRKHGFQYVLRHLQAMMSKLQKEQPDNVAGTAADVQWLVSVGHAVLCKIPENVLRTFLPVNDARFLYVENKVLVEFRSLLREGTGTTAFYYSRRLPELEVGGKPYIVAFSKHAIDQTCDRINPRWLQYAALGDVYAFFEECVYFESCQLLNGHLAFTFYDTCGLPHRFWRYSYVEEVLGEGNLDPAKGEPYYRVGYCPADLIDGRFIRARTLLYPGFRQTPEYGALQSSGMPDTEKTRMAELATKADAGTLLKTGDFSVLKWFHDNGVPQVIQTPRTVYDHFGDE